MPHSKAFELGRQVERHRRQQARRRVATGKTANPCPHHPKRKHDEGLYSQVPRQDSNLRHAVRKSMAAVALVRR